MDKGGMWQAKTGKEKKKQGREREYEAMLFFIKK